MGPPGMPGEPGSAGYPVSLQWFVHILEWSYLIIFIARDLRDLKVYLVVLDAQVRLDLSALKVFRVIQDPKASEGTSGHLDLLDLPGFLVHR